MGQNKTVSLSRQQSRIHLKPLGKVLLRNCRSIDQFLNHISRKMSRSADQCSCNPTSNPLNMEGKYDFNYFTFKFVSSTENEHHRFYRKSNELTYFTLCFLLLTTPGAASILVVFQASQFDTLRIVSAVLLFCNVLMGWCSYVGRLFNLNNKLLSIMQNSYLLGAALSGGLVLALKMIYGPCQHGVHWLSPIFCNPYTTKYTIPCDTAMVVLFMSCLGRLVLPETDWIVVLLAWLIVFVALLFACFKIGFENTEAYLHYLCSYVAFFGLLYIMEIRNMNKYVAGRRAGNSSKTFSRNALI